MNKAQAIHNFWSSFGWEAYDENSIPTGKDAPETPYITYSVSVASLDNVVNLSASLWDRSSSWKSVTEKADEIARYLVESYPVTIKIDEGRLYMTQGSPFAQRMSDDTDDMIRRIYINIQAEYFTAW